jgi:hypothetical protein
LVVGASNPLTKMITGRPNIGSMLRITKEPSIGPVYKLLDLTC